MDDYKNDTNSIILMLGVISKKLSIIISLLQESKKPYDALQKEDYLE